jgi:transcription antitermination factor NusG
VSYVNSRDHSQQFSYHMKGDQFSPSLAIVELLVCKQDLYRPCQSVKSTHQTMRRVLICSHMWLLELLFLIATEPTLAFTQTTRTAGRRISCWPTSRTPNSDNNAIVDARSSSYSSATQLLAHKLWDRLQIEEDEDPFWYLLNCVATNELDLLAQCREVCADMPDVIKFVVPLERKTRSHGVNKMVTETKVKYLGYVFAKLRLCPHAYEAIQSLDLCRSWMGTVNHKGYKKLPPVPVALNDVEVENFGLEDAEDDEVADEFGMDEEGIILDSGEEYDDKDKDIFADPMYKGVDKDALKKFKGLKVGDMVKVTAQGKFFNEDGIVRRLKEGQIFVRFYTYGTLFEEWMDPSAVRKMSPDEILRGLSGPAKPITQRDFDGPSSNDDYQDRFREDNNRPGDVRSSLMGTMRGGRFGGGGEQRNRRQDRTVERSRNEYERSSRQGEENWKAYKNQQRINQPAGSDGFVSDGNDRKFRAGSGNINNEDDNDWAEGDVDSQWGRPSQRQTRRDNQKFGSPRYKAENRQTEAAIAGKDDWSAFVSSAGSAPAQSGGIDTRKRDAAADDFFSSLMSDLNKDLGSGSRQGPQVHSFSTDTSSEDDFFATLLTELDNEAPINAGRESSSSAANRPSPTRRQVGSGASDRESSSSDYDFFSTLVSDLSDKVRTEPSPNKVPLTSNRPPSQKRGKENYVKSSDTDDDFFASLEAELGAALEETPTGSPGSSSLNGLSPANDGTEDFFAQLEAELSPSTATAPIAAGKQAPRERRKASTGKENSSARTVGSSSLDSGDLSQKTVPVLKDMLRERGLKVGGSKAELVDRLLSSSQL